MLNERLCNEGLPINFDCLAFFRHVSIAQRTSVIVFHPLWKILPLWPGLKPTTLCKAEASGIQYDSVGNQIVSLTRFCPTRLSVFRQNGWLRLEILLHCIFCSYILKWTSRVTVTFFCDLWHTDKRHSVLYFEAKQLLWFACSVTNTSVFTLKLFIPGHMGAHVNVHFGKNGSSPSHCLKLMQEALMW